MPENTEITTVHTVSVCEDCEDDRLQIVLQQERTKGSIALVLTISVALVPFAIIAANLLATANKMASPLSEVVTTGLLAAYAAAVAYIFKGKE